MEAFINNISSFPTAIFTTFNIVVLGYWLLVIIGFAELDLLDLDLDLDADGVEGSEASILNTILNFFGLTGAPATVVLTVLSLAGFVISYYAVHFGLLFTSSFALKALSGSAILLVSFLLALPLSGIAIKPLKGFFTRIDAQAAEKSMLGVSCIVRSSIVDSDFGEAHCSIDGASLIIKVRSKDETFKQGDSVVIIEHDKALNIYHVVSSDKFNY